MSIGRIVALCLVVAVILAGAAACVMFKPSIDVSARPASASGVGFRIETE